MSRTIPAKLLQGALARATGAPTWSRRQFLRNGALAAVTLALPWTSCAAPSGEVAIVGAGLAGLSAAYRLKQAGVPFKLYEATGRAGGRVLTAQDAVIDGAHVDFGAEYIDSNHHELLALARELQVPLIDLRSDELIPKVFYFEGQHRTEEELVAAIKPFADRILTDLATLPEDVHYEQAAALSRLDNMSITGYLQQLGMTGWVYNFFDMAMTGEFAMEASEQSALNMLLILSVPIQFNEHYHIMGEHHEVLKFAKGSQSLGDALALQVADQLQYGWELRELNQTGNGYELVFHTSEGERRVSASQVIMAIPFTVLRDVRRNFAFSDRKEACIRELGFGNAAKVAMGFSRRPWREQGFQGYTFTDINNTVIWDSAQGQPTTAGSLSFIGGGKSSTEFQNLSYDQIVNRWLPGAERIFPGVTEVYNKRIAKFCWESNPYARGSYTSYRVGQWSAFAGVEGEPHDGIYFAGEHCSQLHQGFMNGAIETGTQAANTITQLLKQHNT